MRHSIPRTFRRVRFFEALENRNLCAVDSAVLSQMLAVESTDLQNSPVLESSTEQLAAATISFDVNKDGTLTAADAKAVVDSLNRGGPRPVRNGAGEGEPDTAHLDVDDDGFLAPLDALLIINALNEQRPLLPCHNARMPADVDNSGAIDANDLDAVMKYLDATGSHEFLGDCPKTDDQPIFPDVNADGVATPLDALHVVNELNRSNRRYTQAADDLFASELELDTLHADWLVE